MSFGQHRFTTPIDNNFPYMIELFARHSDFLLHDENTEIIPLPLDEGISSLSAILLNDSYYNFLIQGLASIDDLSIVDAAHLIPLKAKAHIDLHKRKNAGQHVNSADLKKHKKDVLHLISFVASGSTILLDEEIKQDMRQFVNEIRDENLRVDQLGVGMTLEQAMLQLETLYQL